MTSVVSWESLLLASVVAGTWTEADVGVSDAMPL